MVKPFTRAEVAWIVHSVRDSMRVAFVLAILGLALMSCGRF